MCATYLIKTNAKDLELLFNIKIDDEDEKFDERIVPYTKGVVVTHKGLRRMNFSLIPSWSKEPKAKFATFNARIETISEKPTWKKPLESKRCLVPMSVFIEPIYSNELAGNMVGFKRTDNKILVAAGIYDEWVNKETGEIIESFAIITTDASDYVARVGHDRSPLFLGASGFSEWISATPKKVSDAIGYLKKNKIDPQLEDLIDRPLKPGWEKRKS